MSSESHQQKSSSTQTASEPPAVPPQPAPEGKFHDLESALAELERLTKESREHAATRSTAERQAADLSTLRKFHEKAHAEIEKLRSENAVLAAEKERMAKQVAEAVQMRRNFEATRAEADKQGREVKRLEGENAALEKKLADLEKKTSELAKKAAEADALRKAREDALAELNRLTQEQGERAPSAATVPMPDDLLDAAQVPFVPANPLAETRAMPPIPEESLERPPSIPMIEPLKTAQLPPQPEWPAKPAPKVVGGSSASLPSQQKDLEAPDAAPSRIKYFCEGCKRKLGAPPEFAGTFGTCKFCGHRGQVPVKSTR